MGKEFQRLFADEKPNKILTVEASGIAIATMAGYVMGTPVVFAKKSASKNLDGDIYHSEVTSYTRGTVFDVQVAKKFLGPEDRVLIIDDFLAKGAALNGLIDIVNQSGAYLCGCGIVIEKGFQEGGQALRAKGVNLHSLAVIAEMTDDAITFAD